MGLFIDAVELEHRVRRICSYLSMRQSDCTPGVGGWLDCGCVGLYGWVDLRDGVIIKAHALTVSGFSGEAHEVSVTWGLLCFLLELPLTE